MNNFEKPKYPLSEGDEHRYIFLIRMNGFNAEPSIDSFYELKMPPGLTSKHIEIMIKLDPDFCKEEMHSDSHVIRHFQFRMSFNNDIFQHICMIRTSSSIEYNDLASYTISKYKSGELEDFLDKAKIVV